MYITIKAVVCHGEFLLMLDKFEEEKLIFVNSNGIIIEYNSDGSMAGGDIENEEHVDTDQNNHNHPNNTNNVELMDLVRNFLINNNFVGEVN